MSHLNIDKLHELAQIKGRCLVSFYAPMQRAGGEVRQNEIRWRIMLKDAREKLTQAGLEKDRIDRMLKPADAKVPDTAFWQHQGNGLALFLSETHCYEFQVSISFEQQVIIGERFYLRPLLSIASKTAH